jgi:hypothetical protein
MTSQTTPPLAPVAFILGAPRSGTTLLRVMLAGHPRLFSPPEMIIAPFATMAERKERLDRRFWEKGGLRRALMSLEGIDVDAARAAEERLGGLSVPEVYAYLQERLSGRLLVDKCPHLCADPEALARVGRWFPEARYLWIVRHPGSVIRSLENMPMAEVMLEGYADDAREIWQVGNGQVQRFLEGIPRPRWALVRYEDLVKDPRPVMERACAALGVPFDEKVLDPYEGDRMREGPKGARAIGDPNMAGRGKIDPELATSWLEGFDPRLASPATRAMATALGYDLDALPLPPVTKVTDALGTLWDTARALEASIRLPMDLDALEGRRFLLRILHASVDMFVEQGDVERPAFFHAEGPHRKMFADCPDADYLRAPIQLGPGRAYRLKGRIPHGTTYVGVLLYGKGGRIGERLTDRQLALDPSGAFEVVVASDEAAAGAAGAASGAAAGRVPWLRGAGDETALIVRQYFTDRGRQAPISLAIERVGEPEPPRPLQPLELAARIGRAERMLRATFERTLGAYKMASQTALNRFIEIPAESLFPTPDNRYRAAWYRFGQDQVMLVRGAKVPRSRYFGFTLYNAWLESFDYTRHRVCLNHEQIATAPDGSFELCLAHRDVGHPNWLDTAGHHAGYAVARALLAEEDPPELAVQVMYEKEWQALRAARAAAGPAGS